MNTVTEHPTMSYSATTLPVPLPSRFGLPERIVGLVSTEQSVTMNPLPSEFVGFIGRTLEASFTAVSPTPFQILPQGSSFAFSSGNIHRSSKAAKLIQLIDGWIKEGPVCDDETWKAFQHDIETYRLSDRKRFSE